MKNMIENRDFISAGNGCLPLFNPYSIVDSVSKLVTLTFVITKSSIDSVNARIAPTTMPGRARP